MALLQLVACFLVLLCINFSVLVYCITFNVTVSLDGSGTYRKINDAITAAPNNSNTRFCIHLMPGIYNEHVQIPSSKSFIALIGDDASTTIIVDNRSNDTGFSTSDSATFTVKGWNFMAKSITFKNSAGPKNGQAVALLSDADQTTYYKCTFLGFQDTLYVGGNFVFFKECEIYGTVDFIFGKGLAVFQDCKIYARLSHTTITITAQSKESENQKSGFSFQNCSVMASPLLGSRKNSNFEVYLGRPWRDYSTVIFMQSFLDDVVDPRGWSEWSPGSPVNLLFYAEFNNRGPGANISERVKWQGFHVINNRSEANKFTVENFINGTTWLPETGVPFRLGL